MDLLMILSIHTHVLIISLSNKLVPHHYYATVFSFLFVACISSRPGQSGRSDGYILEGKELEFYLKKLKSKKGK